MSSGSGDALRAGFIGLGIMGSRMAANLRAAGFELTVWNRTAETAQQWAAQHGAKAVGTPAEVAASSDVVITMVVDGEQVERVLLGDSGAIDGAHDESLFIDMSRPQSLRRHVDDRPDGGAADRSLRERGGIAFLDAPVTGSSPKAEDGTLTIMVGGALEDFERARPLFEAMGELLVHAGPVGDGQMIKLINNTVAAINTAAAGEALLVGRKAGVDLDALVTVMSAGSGGSAMLDLKHQAMRDRDYTTLFKLEHMKKDVGSVPRRGGAARRRPRVCEAAHELLDAADAVGLGEQDFAAMFEALDAELGRLSSDATRSARRAASPRPPGPPVAADVAALGADDHVGRLGVGGVADAAHGRGIDAGQAARSEHVRRAVAEHDLDRAVVDEVQLFLGLVVVVAALRTWAASRSR